MKHLLSLIICVLSINNVSAQLCNVPSTQCSGVNITNVTTNSFRVTWNSGSGNNSIVVIRLKLNARVTPVSTNMSSYSPSTTFGSGTHIGSGNYVAYMGQATNIVITGLNSNTNFEVCVYSYNISTLFGNSYCLNGNITSNYLEKYTLATEPTTSPTIALNGTPNATSAYFSIGGTGYSWNLVAVRKKSVTGYDPVDGTFYSSSGNFENGAEIGGSGTQNHVIYFNSPVNANLSVSNLQPATQYWARVYAANGSGPPSNNGYNYRLNYDVVSFATYNNPPMFNSISNYTICEDGAQTIVPLSNISDGSTSETQNVSFTASSSNPSLISNMAVSYSNPNTTGSFYFKPNTGQSGTAVITLTANDGWITNNITTRTFTVLVNPKPSSAGSISTATTTICQVKNGVSFSVPTIANATSYVWSFPSGSTLSAPNLNSTDVNFNTTLSSFNVSVYGTNTNGCGNGPASTQLVNFDKLPTPSNAGVNQQICNNLTGLTANTSSVGTGAWTFCSTGLGSISSPSSPNSNLQVVNNTTVTSVWTTSNGVCPVSSSSVVVTNIFGSPSCTPKADFLASNASPCVNTAVIFYNTSVGATSSLWSFGATATPSTSTASNSVSVVFATGGPKTVTLTIGSANGPDTETKTSTVISTPAAPAAISGNTLVCQDLLAQPYFINPVASANNYIWSFPTGITKNTGANTNAITANFNSNAQSGNIGVYASNACGNSAVTNLSVTVNPLPTVASAIAGSSVICQGQQSVIYTAQNLNNAISYTWNLPNGATITSGLNTATITVNYNTAATSGTISVYGTNSCGNGATLNQTIIVNPLPDAAGLIDGGLTNASCPLSANINYSINAVPNATSYDWVIPNGYAIVSGTNTNSVFVDASLASQNGSFKVVGKNACGAGDTSNVLLVSFAGIPTQELCVVTVDSSSLYNEIVWQKNGASNIDSFKVYRVQSLSLDTLIGTIGYADLSSLVDSTANPNVTSYTYKISAVDFCGNEGVKSNAHQTIHLQSIYSSTPKKTDLSWNTYVGATVDNYRVLRDTNNSGNWQVLANSLAPNVTSFTDLVIPTDAISLQYRVDVIWTNSCDASLKMAQSVVNTTRSNTKDFVLPTTTTTTPIVDVGIKNQDALTNSVSVFPNPTQDVFNINIDKSVTDFDIEIYNQLGSLVYTESIKNSNEAIVNIKTFSAGIYILVIKTNYGTVKKRISKY